MLCVNSSVDASCWAAGKNLHKLSLAYALLKSSDLEKLKHGCVCFSFFLAVSFLEEVLQR